MDLLLTTLNLVVLGVMVEAKYCPIEIDGDVKYYICPRNEICCTFGCCISSSFHFYQLWYYWLMVILMFLLCSGGTWWYRYWLHEGHYPSPPPPPHRPQLRRPPPTRVAYHAGRNTVVVQQIWKPPRNGPGFPSPPPQYSHVHISNDPVVESSARPVDGVPTHLGKLKPSSLYYQMYGPPPSYDSVIGEGQSQQTEGGCNPQNTVDELHADESEQGVSTVNQVTQTHSTVSHAVQSTSRSQYSDTTTLPK